MIITEFGKKYELLEKDSSDYCLGCAFSRDDCEEVPDTAFCEMGIKIWVEVV
jgi:hypothetical protein